MNKVKQLGQKGFTVVELLIVIVIIGILAALVFVQFNGMQQRGRDAERVSDLRLLDSKLAEYYADKGSYPATSAMPALKTALEDELEGAIETEAFEDPREGDTGFGYSYFSDGESYRLEAPMEAAAEDENPHTRGTYEGN